MILDLVDVAIDAAYAAVKFVFLGRLCPRCQDERTGRWAKGYWTQGRVFKHWHWTVCDTCEAVIRIRERQ